MHLLLINYEYPPIGGGAGNATRYNAEWLARDHHVTVLTSQYGDLPHDERQGNLRIVRVPSRRRRQDRSNTFEMTVFMWHATRAVSRLWREDPPDATIAYFGIPGGPPAWWLQRQHGVPYIVALRGGDVPGTQPQQLRRHHRAVSPILRRIWRSAAAVTTNSAGLRDIARGFMPELDILVIPNGVDCDRFGPASGTRRDGPLRLIYVGRLSHEKGLDYLFHGLQLADQLDIELALIGDGPERPQWEARCRELGIAERVTFHGWTDRAQVPALLQQADCFVMPSTSEGMPNVVLEAMSCGLPVLGTDIPGIRDLIIPGETGWLVPAADAQALAAGIRDVAADRTRLTTYGAAGRQRVREHYSWQQSADLYVDLIQHILRTGS